MGLFTIADCDGNSVADSARNQEEGSEEREEQGPHQEQ